MDERYRQIIQTISLKDTPEVPVCLWAIGQTYAPFAGMSHEEYYENPEKILAAWLGFYEEFKEVFTDPGIWPDLGLIPEAGALGCEIRFSGHSPLQVWKLALALQEVDKLRVPNPPKDEYTSPY